MSRFSQGDVRGAWIGGALHLTRGRTALLVDAPEGVAGRLGEAPLAALDAVLVSSGVLRDLAGLLPLLEARSRLTERALQVIVPGGDERAAALLDVWQRGWPSHAPVIQDAVHPGAQVALGDVLVEALPISRGEPRWQPAPTVEPTPALAWRVRAGRVIVAVARGARPDRGLDRAMDGADLRVVEVGAGPWPAGHEAWRLAPEAARRRMPTSGTTWVVTDDGDLLDDEAT